ncbi:SusD/RagB family nutrient-binding outer membrane lipoprotein [Mucilaginibacter sp. BJC16-A38]|uniref:SusD/RagB family nutrient-binding outer membrane lipoprotein n=1 Tax=Mucilaginibacter phenanthrenivorans TaxID=1234842 RepID=UPI00215738B4|nr:SusD/RagB family nutrient-binding outer membrane lipoprotein [Mucilaginibacter phenanthrenivorans]MCR8556610.1 SusD/RagB family nutrient-binding outer membrane lipoprotein [Mucilaginibacter phenanthrenivorans]
MKKYIYCLLIIFGIITIQSCTKNFEKFNTDPNSSPKPVPGYIFTKAEYDGVSSMMNLLLGTMQYTTSFNDVAGFGSKYILAQSQQSAAEFSSAYPNQINELVEVLKAVGTDASQSNLIAEARIWRVYCFSRLTDLYGDIPYSQAGQGYNGAIYKPVYDPQKDIYADMLKELDQSATSLDAGKSATFGDADLIYSGNPGKWKKFAYSLMLRLAMRMTKVDIAGAQTWATKAITGGVILDDADIAKVPYVGSGQDININPLANDLWNSDYIAQDGFTNTEGGKYQDVFISHLKTNKDPRLGVISIVYVNKVADTSFAIQKGMSAGLNTKPADFATYSEPNPKTLLLLSSPRLVFTAAESYFLLAEAASRGWYNGLTASAAYESGISASMRQWALIGGATGTITDNQINTYIAHHKFVAGTLDQNMEQIYTEFWVGLFPDAEETFATYRRTGYPALVPNNYVGNATGGKIFRRMLYPISEQNLNAASYAAAISRQGPDDFLTRIWWDKQ